MATDTDVPLARDLMTDALGRVYEQVPQVVEGLSVDDLTWRPDADANSIGWLIWHLARVQDDHLAGLSTACGRHRDQVWTRWRGRFALPYAAEDIGYGHSSADVAAFTVGDPALLTGYHAEVHAMSVEVLEELSEADHRRVVDENFDPPVTAAVRLVSVVGDVTAHIGQAQYVKGLLQRR